jgi:hypothetical protein
MKQKELVTRNFVDILCLIETSVNKHLVSNGSLGKFVFKVNVQGTLSNRIGL